MARLETGRPHRYLHHQLAQQGRIGTGLDRRQPGAGFRKQAEQFRRRFAIGAAPQWTKRLIAAGQFLRHCDMA